MKKTLVFLSLLLVLVVSVSFASASIQYTYTSSITASLSFGGSLAYCSGTVTPSGIYDTSITVRLLRQDGNSWIFVTSWFGSATGGHTAAAGGSISVASGTYKVTSYGVIGDGLEYPTASIIRTK